MTRKAPPLPGPQLPSSPRGERETGATVIPFPRFGLPAHRRAGSFGSAEFDSGFECAMHMMQVMKKRGLLRGQG